MATGFVVAAGLTALGLWQVGMTLNAVLILSYLLPPIRPVYIPGGAPGSDVEEADERY